MEIELNGKTVDSRDVSDRDLEAQGWGSHAVQRMRDEEDEEIRCEHCRDLVDEDKDLDDEGLCYECQQQAGQDRAEAHNDLD